MARLDRDVRSAPTSPAVETGLAPRSGSRRSLLSATGLGLAALGLAPAARADVVTSGLPKDVGRKFEPDGRVRPFAGNTVIAHVPQQGAGYEAFDRLLDIVRELPRFGFARKVTTLPTSSYHMTVFGGPTDQGRSAATWPAGLPLDAPIEVCNGVVRDRLRALRLPYPLPLAMVVDERPASARTSPITLHLRPQTEAVARQLEAVRRAIGAALGIAVPTPDAYQFHITIAYQIAAFTPTEAADYIAAMSRWQGRLIDRGVVFNLGAPEYCTFADMFAFRSEFPLAHGRDPAVG